MRRKIYLATALAVCLALVFAAISAADRTRRSRDASRAPSYRASSPIEDISQTFDPRFRREIANTGIEFNAAALQAAPGESALIATSAERKAMTYLARAYEQQNREGAYTSLRKVLDLGLDKIGSKSARRLQSAAYQRLADLYTDPSRQAYLLSRAIEFTDSPGIREGLEARLEELGGTPEIVTLQRMASNTTTPLDYGPDDTCLGAPPVAVPSITTMSIADPMPPRPDTNYLEIVIPGPLGQALEIETTSPFCDDDVSCRDNAFDTDMSLWAKCAADGTGFQLVADDPTGDSGLGWLSKLDTTCLLPGSYYLQVFGQFGNAPKDFDVEVRNIGTCEVPLEDAFEPDDTIADAKGIGKPSSIPDQANGWLGRENSENQNRSIFPPNDDDNILIKLTRTERVFMGTQASFPTRRTPNIPSGPEEDTQLILFYEDDPHGGICNTGPVFTILNYCKSDADCDPNADPVIPDFPADTCFPLFVFTFGGEAEPRFFPDNAIAFNDDVSPENLGSELDMCLPRTQPGGPALAVQGSGFAMRGRGWRPPFPGSSSDLAFDYMARAVNQGDCPYEQEPNQSFATATPVQLLNFQYGMWEGSETYPFADADLWGPFDVNPPEEEVSIEVFPTLINPFGDSELQLFVGPDDNGDFFLVLDETDDTGNEPNSRINTVLMPANELLENQVADAGYYINVTGFDIVPNWYYSLRIITPLVLADEEEPNDPTPQVVDFRGKTFITADISATCDIDRFQVEVTENTFLDVYTSDPSTDTVLTLEQLGVGGSLEVTNEVGFTSTSTIPATDAAPAAYGPAATRDNFMGEVVLADDGAGSFGCAPIINDVAGKVALVDRGACGFATKTQNAQDAGATAVLVNNDRDQDLAGFEMGGDCDTCTIASLLIPQDIGFALKAELPGVDAAYIGGAYDFGDAAYGPRATRGNFNGEVVLADDGSGGSFGCGPIDNDLTGKIALVDRGVCGFVNKTVNAQNAGASAVLVANDRPQDVTTFTMGGDCATCTIASLLITQDDGALFKGSSPGVLVEYEDELLGCDDDGRTEGSNAFLSQISGCVPPGDYVVSVRGWDTSTGPYVLSITGAAGCVPTDPPTINETGTGSSSFCPPNSFLAGCVVGY